MSGVMMMMFGGKGAGVNNPIPDINLYAYFYGGIPSVSVTVKADGSIAVSGIDQDGGAGSTSGGGWYSPTTAGIGSGYWVRMTLLSGTAPGTSPGLGTWLQLSSDRQWGWSRASNGSTTATVKIEIATDSGGTNIVATESSIAVSVSRTDP